MNLHQTYEAIRPRYPELKDRVALVTGSSLGIGKSIALRLAREGMRIVIHGKDEASIENTLAEFNTLGIHAQGIHADFSEADGVDHLFDTVSQQHEHIHLLVNNAADLRRTAFQNATEAMLDHQLQVNVRSPYLCSLKAAPMMPAGSSIINISSVGGTRAHWRGLPYDVTKGAVESMTRAMALNLIRDDIRVNAIAPGAIFVERATPELTERLEIIASRIPAGRLGHKLEVGAMVAFLASDDAAYIVGQVIFVDGGISAQLSPPGQPI